MSQPNPVPVSALEQLILEEQAEIEQAVQENERVHFEIVEPLSQNEAHLIAEQEEAALIENARVEAEAVEATRVQQVRIADEQQANIENVQRAEVEARERVQYEEALSRVMVLARERARYGLASEITPESFELISNLSVEDLEEYIRVVMPELEAARVQQLDNIELQRFFSQRLHDGPEFFGAKGKSLILDPRYQEFSNIYPSARYPKIPRVHPYHGHTRQHNYLSLEIPKTLISNVFLNQIFKEIPFENINIFFLAQNSQEEDIILRPHYYVDSEVVAGDVAFNSNKRVFASIFNLENTHLTLKDQANNAIEEGVFFENNINTHPGINAFGAPDLVVSPDNFRTSGYSRSEGAFFASVVINREVDPQQSKGALTFHYLPPLELGLTYNLPLYNAVQNAETVQDIIEYPAFHQLSNFDDVIENIAQKIQFVTLKMNNL